MSNRDPETRVRAALQAVLPAEVRVNITRRAGVASTFDVIVGAASTKHRLLVGWAGEGWPADVEQLVELARDLDAVAARDLSVGARERLTEHRIGWVDESGRSNLSLPSGLVVVRDVAPSPKEPQTPRWSASTVAVAEAALSGVRPQVDAMQHATALSRGSVARALTHLESFGYLQRDVARGPLSARRVVDPSDLLDGYARAVADQREKASVIRLHRLWDDPLAGLIEEVAPALTETGTVWAATGAAASLLLAPYLSEVASLEVYVATELFTEQALADVLGARIVDRGNRIEVRSLPNYFTATAGLVAEAVRCAPSARVYADLLARGGRFAEAAAHLREVLDVGTDPEPSSTAAG